MLGPGGWESLGSVCRGRLMVVLVVVVRRDVVVLATRLNPGVTLGRGRHQAWLGDRTA